MKRFVKRKIFVSGFFVIEEVLFGDLKRFIEFDRTIYQSDLLLEKSKGLLTPV